jgi:probable HAF family extracellular repeat protein
MMPVAMPAQTKSSEAHGTNNRGQIVGDFRRSGETHAFLWTHRTGLMDLGVLPNCQGSRATGVNDAGEVVGSSSGAFGTLSFIWTPAEGIQPITDIPATDFSEALDINNQGQIVGTYEDSLGNRAYLWSSKNGFSDLNSLVPAGRGLVLTIAVSVNDRGEILALGMSHPDISPDHHMDQDEEDDLHGVDVHAFLLTPTSSTLLQ